MSAVHFASYNAFCVLNGDSALCVCHKDNKPNHYNVNHKNYDDEGNLARVRLAQLNISVYVVGEARYDTREEYHRDTVSDALFVNSVAEPDDNRCARNKASYNGNRRKYLRERVRSIAVFQKLGYTAVLVLDAAAKREIKRNRLNKRNSERGELCDFVYLLPSLFTFLGKSLERRNGNRQKLNDNRRVDVGRNGHRQQRSLRERAARHRVEVVQQRGVADELSD